MATKPFIAARIPEGLNNQLEEHTRETGESRTQALINALAQYLNYDFTVESQESASDRLSLIEKRVAKLEDLIHKPQQINLLEFKSSEELIPKLEEREVVIKEDKKTDNKNKASKREDKTDTKLMTHSEIVNLTGLNYSSVKSKHLRKKDQTIKWQGRTFAPVQYEKSWKWKEITE